MFFLGANQFMLGIEEFSGNLTFKMILFLLHIQIIATFNIIIVKNQLNFDFVSST